MNNQSDIGLIGLAVMGQNLALNMNDHGYRVCVYNRTTQRVDEFLAGPGKESNIIGTHSIKEMVQTLKRPRRILLMVKAGKAVDLVIEQCLEHLEKGDILIDGGNSLYKDTSRRCRELEDKGIQFIGMGVSGGEEGARHGPSLMPGGNPDAWPHVKEIFQSISAHVDGQPCCEWLGTDGAGHYVKMVHNGIEYGDMQLICEAYHLLKVGLKYTSKQLHAVFKKWNEGELNSFLIEITADIFNYLDSDGTPLVDKILDAAGQKGTGKWTVIDSLERGFPLTLIAEAVFARCLSALKEEREEASRILKGPENQFLRDHEETINEIHDALYASKISSYAQGFMLMQNASNEHHWDLDLGTIAMMWRGGCIIRSSFLAKIKDAYANNSSLKCLFLDPYFKKAIESSQKGWRNTVANAAKTGVPIPCFSSALSFYDGYRHQRLPANLLQAQRDYFGAHTYERIDQPRGKFFHTDWTGKGGKVSASSYNA